VLDLKQPERGSWSVLTVYIVSVSHTTFANWRKADHQRLPAQANDLTHSEITEVDELYTFAGKRSVLCSSSGESGQAADRGLQGS